MKHRWAVVACETTGLNIKHDHLIAVSVLVLTEAGLESGFSSLIKPPCRIPITIERLTGIGNEQVADAPSFAELALYLKDILSECIFVSHNVIFSYSFLKAHFKSLQMPLSRPVLCTIKLFKKLYPNLSSYQLRDLAELHALPIKKTDRAVTDAFLLHQLLQIAKKDYGLKPVLEAAQSCYKKSSVPAHLKTEMASLPDAPGVYLFYSAETDLPLYIGKSISIRQRVLSHFQASHTDAKEFKLTQQVERVEFIPTAGELSALLLESELIKTHLPLFNRKLRRKKILLGFKFSETPEGYLRIETGRETGDRVNTSLYGSYHSMAAAKKALLHLVKAHQLCPKLCGLETAKKACFSYQLKRCLGACIHEEPAEIYNLRVMTALNQLKEMIWPFQGAIAIKEESVKNQITQWMKFNQWRYLGSVAHFEDLKKLQEPQKNHDLDAYYILLTYIKHQLKPEQLMICEA